MTSVPQHTLPLAMTSPFTPSARLPASDPGHWGQTFGRALQGIPVGPAAPVNLVVSLPPSAQPALLVQRAGVAPSTTASQVVHPNAEDGKLACASAGSGQVSVSGNPTTCALLPAAPDAEPAPSRPPTQCPARQNDPTPVRVHVEHHPDGLAIWIGADATVGTNAVTSMLFTLRSAQPNTGPIASLVVNGRTVYANTRPPKENP